MIPTEFSCPHCGLTLKAIKAPGYRYSGGTERRELDDETVKALPVRSADVPVHTLFRDANGTYCLYAFTKTMEKGVGVNSKALDYVERLAEEEGVDAYLRLHNLATGFDETIHFDEIPKGKTEHGEGQRAFIIIDPIDLHPEAPAFPPRTKGTFA